MKTMKRYPSVADAYEAHNLNYDQNTLVNITEDALIDSVRIIPHYKSLNRFFSGLDYIHYVGIGKQKTPGYPTLNQNALEQMPFYRSKSKGNTFPVFFKDNNAGLLLGHYNVSNIEKKMTNSGFTYFLISFVKQY